MNGVSGGKIFGMKDYQVEMRVEISWGLSGLSQYNAYWTVKTTSSHMWNAEMHTQSNKNLM